MINADAMTSSCCVRLGWRTPYVTRRRFGPSVALYVSVGGTIKSVIEYSITAFY